MMKKHALKVNQYEFHILKNLYFNEFTIADLHELFNNSCIHLPPIPANRVPQRIYRMIQRLMAEEVLVQVSNSNDKRKKTYKKTPLFAETEFIVRGVQKEGDPQAMTMHNSDRRSGDLDPKIDEQLKLKIRVYQVDLLTSIGESEEYKRLGHEYPGLKHQLEPNYLDARARSSRLLGQIKALKYVLQQLPPRQA